MLYVDNVVAQKIYYSDRERNGLISNYSIIGQVKNNIVVWITKTDNPKDSKIVIYDNKMHSVNEVKIDVLGAGKFYNADFINSKDSFQLIYQYISKNAFLCKRLTFDELGNNLSTELLDSIPVKSDDKFLDHAYMVVESKNKESFALIRGITNEQNNVDFQYYLFSKNKKYSGHLLLPFNLATSEGNCLLLDDEDNLVLGFNDTISNEQWLYVYKINLKNNSVINKLRQLNEGQFIAKSITISQENDQYIFTGQWLKGLTNSIFLWRLKMNDLSDIKNDTLITISSKHDTLFKDFDFFETMAFADNENIKVFLLSRDTDKVVSMLMPNPQTNYLYSYNQFSGLLDQYRASDFLFVDDLSLNKPEKLKLAYFKIGMNNKIENPQVFDGMIDPAVISKINNPSIFQYNSIFNILFEQVTGKEMALGYIRLNGNKSEYKQLNLMHLRYRLLISQAKQINAEDIVMPCSFQNKLVFAKISFN